MSEENILNLDDQPHPEINNQQIPEGWESKLHARAVEFLRGIITDARREADLETKDLLRQAAKDWGRAAQLEHNIRLQKRIEEVRGEMAAENEAKTKELLKMAIRHWDRAAQLAHNVELKKRLEEAEKEFLERLKQAARDWQEADQRDNEVTFQKRLEQACAEAAAVARRESEVQIEDIREQLEASRKALTLAVSSSQPGSALSSGHDSLRSAVEEIDSQRTQSETLTSLVNRASKFAPRVVFFVVKGGEAVGWKASGFENGLNDETVRQLTVATHNQSLLQEALAGFRTAVGRSSSPGDNSAVLGHYGSPAPQRAIAVPLVVRGKAAAVLYADSGNYSENSINSAAIELLMRVASMGIELLPARRGFEPPRSNLSSAQSGGTSGSPISQAFPPAPAAIAEQPPVEARSAFVHEPVEPAIGKFEQPVEQTTAPERTFEPPQYSQFEEAEQVRTTDELIRPAGVDETPDETESRFARSAQTVFEPKVEPPPVPAPPLPPPVADERKPFDESRASAPTIPFQADRQTLDIRRDEERVQEQNLSAEEPSTTSFDEQPDYQAPPEPPSPPPPVVSVPTPASETEQRAHNDARRFARLLVSEIKLYNAAKVNEGRRNFDLYDRLKDEIDRSRKVYDKRVSPVVAARFDYFYDELVQTLAEGDPAKLGPECPGPVVLTS